MSDWTDAEDELAKELYFRRSDETTDRIIKSDPLYMQGRAEALEEVAVMFENEQAFTYAAAIRSMK